MDLPALGAPPSQEATRVPPPFRRSRHPRAPKPLTPEMTLKRWSVGDLQLSPDGSRLAMVVSEPAKPTGQRRNIWLYDFATRALCQFTASAKSDTRPRWSPDGRTLAFLSNRDGETQIYLIAARRRRGPRAHRRQDGHFVLRVGPGRETARLRNDRPEDRRRGEEGEGQGRRPRRRQAGGPHSPPGHRDRVEGRPDARPRRLADLRIRLEARRGRPRRGRDRRPPARTSSPRRSTSWTRPPGR